MKLVGEAKFEQEISWSRSVSRWTILALRRKPRSCFSGVLGRLVMFLYRNWITFSGMDRTSHRIGRFSLPSYTRRIGLIMPIDWKAYFISSNAHNKHIRMALWCSWMGVSLIADSGAYFWFQLNLAALPLLQFITKICTRQCKTTHSAYWVGSIKIR